MSLVRVCWVKGAKRTLTLGQPNHPCASGRRQARAITALPRRSTVDLDGGQSDDPAVGATFKNAVAPEIPSADRARLP